MCFCLLLIPELYLLCSALLECCNGDGRRAVLGPRIYRWWRAAASERTQAGFGGMNLAKKQWDFESDRVISLLDSLFFLFNWVGFGPV